MEFLPKPKEVKLLTGEHALCYDGRIVLEGRLLGNGDTYAGNPKGNRNAV